MISDGGMIPGNDVYEFKGGSKDGELREIKQAPDHILFPCFKNDLSKPVNHPFEPPSDGYYEYELTQRGIYEYRGKIYDTV